MHKGGWRPFWAALGAALLVLLPLVGGTVLLTRRMLHTQLLAQTAEPQQGVPITLPKEDDRMTVLLCTAGEQPGFLLLYLNAPQNVCGLLAVPGELTVPFGDGEASLTRCYAAAGPCGWGSPGHSPPKSWPPSARPAMSRPSARGKPPPF